MVESEAIQTATIQVAIQAATVTVMRLRESITGTTLSSSTVNAERFTDLGLADQL